MKNKIYFSKSRIFAVAILFVLTILNVAWFLTSKQGGPLIGGIAYAIIGFRCLRDKYARVVVIAGLAGLAVHIIEAFILNVSVLPTMEQIYFLLNLILPISLIITSYKNFRT